jgi:hypothetical protein
VEGGRGGYGPAWAAPQGVKAVPIAFRSGHPFVETRITLADGRAIDSRMNLDTGMNRTLTLAVGSHPALAMPANGTPKRSCYVNGVREEREGGPVSVVLGGASIPVGAPVYSTSPNAADDRATSTIGIGLSLPLGHGTPISRRGGRLSSQSRGRTQRRIFFAWAGTALFLIILWESASGEEPPWVIQALFWVMLFVVSVRTVSHVRHVGLISNRLDSEALDSRRLVPGRRRRQPRERRGDHARHLAPRRRAPQGGPGRADPHPQRSGGDLALIAGALLLNRMKRPH